MKNSKLILRLGRLELIDLTHVTQGKDFTVFIATHTFVVSVN